jgi:serine/threonine-protein kinase HipA
MTQKEIQVYAHWQGFDNPVMMGVLHTTPTRGKEIFSFEYAREWLNSGKAQRIDPDLQLFSGPQYLGEEKSNFGIFLDSSPDRWGRILMLRREAAIARVEGRKERTLLESDYLLGVFDQYRIGALRFKEKEDGPFLNDNKEMASPPWTSLRELEYASLQLEKDNIIDDPEYLKWLNMLIAPGSSLGGARPKASVVDQKNNLWIAKFPSGNDIKDIGAWEMIVNELAGKAGLNIAEGKAQKFSGHHHTYLSKRFDRTKSGERIHFASAMTLLGYMDGTDNQDGASYLELAEFLMQNGAEVEKDLEEIWRRIVFSICVKNTDDHLRNHGFLLTERGWILSPAYDINPVETGTGLKLNISENDNALDLGLAMQVAGYFRIVDQKASKIMDHVKKSVEGWRQLAEKYKISKTEQAIMAKAFWTE